MANAALEKKALASENKSDGMRMLFDNGYEVAAVKDLFGVPYGFAYGVAVRHGAVTPTARDAKPASKTAKAAKAPARPAAKTKAAAKPARAAKAAAPKGKRKATAKA